MTFIFLFISLITVFSNSTTHTMEMPAHKINERIIACVKKGDLDRLKNIHQNNPTVAFTKINSAGMPLVHIAAGTHNIAMMSYLLDVAKLNPHIIYEGRSILHTAANHGSVPMSKYLIEKKSFDKNLPDAQGNCAIDLAKRNRHFGLINYYFPTIINPTVKMAQHLKAVDPSPDAKLLPCLICTE